jgi:hypothetical protein
MVRALGVHDMSTDLWKVCDLAEHLTNQIQYIVQWQSVPEKLDE